MRSARIVAISRPHSELVSSRAKRATRSRGTLCLLQSESAFDTDPELSLYRPRTLAILRRYLQISSAVGRLPSLIARECFRARVSSYRITTFEDSVIFVLDVERSLERLAASDQLVITRVVFQGHSHDSAARLLSCSRKTLTQSLCGALDHLSELLLARGLLRRL